MWVGRWVVSTGPARVVEGWGGSIPAPRWHSSAYHEYMVMQGSPSGGVTRNPGVTQVDEKGHEGNKAVVTAYLYRRKRGERNNRTRVSADCYYLL